jgi:hypothetical protein
LSNNWGQGGGERLALVESVLHGEQEVVEGAEVQLAQLAKGHLLGEEMLKHVLVHLHGEEEVLELVAS